MNVFSNILNQSSVTSFEELGEFLKEILPSTQDTLNSVGGSETVDAAKVLGDAGMTVLIGMVVVMATLIALTLVFYLFGFIMSSADRKAKKQKMKEQKAAASAPVAQAAPVAPAAPVVQHGIPAEVVAAIAAAVAMMAPEGKRYAVKSVSRRDAGGRSAWAAAGIADNTRPF